jgi:hypothetical protein
VVAFSRQPLQRERSMRAYNPLLTGFILHKLGSSTKKPKNHAF